MNIERASNADLDIIANQRDRQHRPGLTYRLFSELAISLPNKDWLIKGVFARGETSAWIGPPGSLKSSLLASAAVSVSSGRDWFGYRSKSTAAVAIFALERAELVERRLEAHRIRDDLPANLPIAVVPGVLDLMNPRCVPTVLATLRGIEDDTGLPVGFVIFDTFAKAIAAGGGDENTAKDQGRVFANVQRIKDDLRPHIALVGHTGKDEARGARGSNAILGDVDVMVTLAGDDVRTATVTKANDSPEGPLFSFTSEVRDFGPDEDGDPVTVNIVCRDPIEARPRAAEPKLTPNQRTMFGILHDNGPAGLTKEEWNARARDAGLGLSRKADLHDIKGQLKRMGLVSEYGERWMVRHV